MRPLPPTTPAAFALERAGKIDMARLDGGHEREKHCRANADRDARAGERANPVVRDNQS